MDMEATCGQSIAEFEAFHPSAVLVLDSPGTLAGDWDRERIAQLFSNLISNAVRHGLAESPVTIVLRGDETRVTVAVHNHGPPIADDDQRRIFQPMVQAGSVSPSGRTEGLGLGLYIVREIVYAHGGTIELVSAADVGTTFSVSLPRR
jgi:signal transduction histidine kinase